MFYELLMAKARKQKQQDYIELEYIGNTSTSYIFFPLVTAGKDIVEIEYEAQFTRLDVQQAEIKNGFPYFFIGCMANSVWYAGCTNYGNSTVKADKNWHKFKLVSYGDDNGFWLDGERIYQGGVTTAVFLPEGFRLWIGQGGSRNTYNRKKYVKVKVNGQLVYDLIPVLDKDLEPCLYDKVSGQYFYNQGGGEFEWKLPNQLEYIRTTDDSYTIIDVITDGSYTIEAKCRAVSIPDNTVRCFGGYMWQGDSSIYNNPRSSIGCYNKRWHVGYNKTGQAGTCDTNLHVFKLVEFLKFGEDFNADYFSVDGEQLAISHGSTVDFYSNTKRNWAIGGRIQSAGFKNPLDAEHYYWKFWDGNDKLVAYIIPVFDENLTPCMYDLVSKKYFYNIGTGQFKGPDDNSLIV